MKMGGNWMSSDGPNGGEAAMKMPEPAPEEPVNAEILSGKYQLFASIGSGGMAEVFLGVARGPRGFNKIVVIKRLRTNLANEQENFVDMFLDEARLAARLNHPNIVSTYEVGEHESSLFIAMEFLDGQSLRSLTSRAAGREVKVPLNIAVHTTIEVLKGLHCAHELRDYDGSALNVVHRDVSPHNIFITYDGAVKLVDFGIAKASVNSSETVAGTFKGKPGYMAPEQLTNECDRRTDVFSMGIVLFELVTGTRLFPGEAMKALHNLMSQELPRASTRVPDLDPALDEIIDKALQRKVELRYSTAEEMQHALEDWLRKRGRVEAKEVGTFVSELFKDVRETIRKRIEVQMAKTTSGGPSTPFSRTYIAKIDVEPSSRNSDVIGVDSKVMHIEPASRRRTIIFGAIGVLVLLIGGVVLLLRPSAAPVLVAPAAIAPAPPLPVRTGKEGALLTLVSDPVGANIEWSGRSFGPAPTTLALPPGAQKLTVSKDGFLPEVIAIDVPNTSEMPLMKTVLLKPVAKPVAAQAQVAKLRPRPQKPMPASAPAPIVTAPAVHHAAPAPVAAPVEAPAPQPKRPSVINIDDNKPKVRVIQ